MFNYLDPFAFVVSFGVGILLVYAMNPKPELVVKFPTPLNSGKAVYRDESSECFKYKYEEVDCDTYSHVALGQPPSSTTRQIDSNLEREAMMRMHQVESFRAHRS